MSRIPTDSDHLILDRTSKMPITSKTVKGRMHKLLIKSGLRGPLTKGNRRHTVPTTHGFRRYWDKVMMQTESTRGTLSALVIKERLLGHYGLVKTDKNYFWPVEYLLVPRSDLYSMHILLHCVTDVQKISFINWFDSSLAGSGVDSSLAGSGVDSSFSFFFLQNKSKNLISICPSSYYNIIFLMKLLIEKIQKAQRCIRLSEKRVHFLQDYFPDSQSHTTITDKVLI